MAGAGGIGLALKSAHRAGSGSGGRFVIGLPRIAALKPSTVAHAAQRDSNGEDALEKAKTFPPEILLLDLDMPGMDGFEVARRLRAAPGDKPIKLVAQTGWGQEEDRRRTREAGFDAHLAKPVDMASLQQLL